MLNILGLFGKSPFSPIQSHVQRVATCVHLLPTLFQALLDSDWETLEKIATQISDLEHEADLIKHDIRNQLRKEIIFPIDRGNLREILTIQDSIANKAEDVAVLVTLKQLMLFDEFKETFFLFLKQNIETFDLAKKIIEELPELVESSFGGTEADKVRRMVDEVAYKEHLVDLTQRKLLKDLFKAENKLNYITFYLWQRLFENIAGISNGSETLAYRVRMTLEIK